MEEQIRGVLISKFTENSTSEQNIQNALNRVTLLEIHLKLICNVAPD
jgi:hypothetical protein